MKTLDFDLLQFVGTIIFVAIPSVLFALFSILSFALHNREMLEITLVITLAYFTVVAIVYFVGYLCVDIYKNFINK